MAWLRLVLLLLVARPLAKLMLGCDVGGPGRLPERGPAIVAANHNSHVDTLLLLALFSPRALARVRPVAAADYFLSNPVISVLSRHVIGIVPIDRTGARGRPVDVLAPMRDALAAGDILVIFPEGTRGSASNEMGALKDGVARLVERAPDCPVHPVWIQGAGRVLPKGGHVPAPLTCCAIVGQPIRFEGDRRAFMERLRADLEALKALAPPLRWSERSSVLSESPATSE